MEEVPVLIIIGSVGVGKTSVADEISEILKEKSISHVLIDMDYLRYAFPRPSNDWFHWELGIKNLTAVWKNYKEVGVKKVIIPNVLEDRKDMEDVKKAIPDAKITIVRLTAPIEIIHNRIRSREKNEKSLEWHLKRSEQLTKLLDEKNIEDFTVDTENKTIHEIAGEILEKINWKS